MPDGLPQEETASLQSHKWCLIRERKKGCHAVPRPMFEGVCHMAYYLIAYDFPSADSMRIEHPRLMTSLADIHI
jgi:hypothetical protein